MAEVNTSIAVSSTSGFKQLNQTAECEVNKTFQYKFIPPIYIIVFVVGFCTNCSVLVSLCLQRRKWTSVNVFVFNLGLADLLYVITLPFLVSYYASHGRWIFGEDFCRITRLVFHLNLYGSIGFLTCISVQRYLGIVYPMKVIGRWRRRHSALISILVWGLVLIQTSVDLYFTKTNAARAKCHDTTGNEELTDYLLYIQVISVTGFVIPFLVILGCYCQIAVVLTRNNNLDITLKERSRSLAIIVMVVFSVCFTPYHVLRYLNLHSRYFQTKGLCLRNTRTVYLVYQISRGLVSLNSCIDPLVYFVARGDMITNMKIFKEKISLSLSRTTGSNYLTPQRNLITSNMLAHNETTV
uniref:P2Y purinoceptor 1-like n=1 Tax=Pristiophorus japonicus TaxID=55135 RepID=UPI00398E8427